MTRPASDSRQRLLRAGRAIFEEDGFSGLSVRAVAARAKVNIGLVSYHFGGKHAFVRAVAQDIYEDFFRDFSLGMEGEPDPLQGLRRALLRLARFISDHHRLALTLVREASHGDKDAWNFVRENGPRHGKVIAGLVKRCMAEGRLKKRPLIRVMPFIMGSVVVPCTMVDTLSRLAPRLPFNLTHKAIEANLTSNSALQERVDLALGALKP
jgi:AcrR family transcriptional regulator